MNKLPQVSHFRFNSIFSVPKLSAMQFLFLETFFKPHKVEEYFVFSEITKLPEAIKTTCALKMAVFILGQSSFCQKLNSHRFKNFNCKKLLSSKVKSSKLFLPQKVFSCTWNKLKWWNKNYDIFFSDRQVASTLSIQNRLFGVKLRMI